ncbi:MAG TPA: METTL5 family protein [Candidatus Nanoarchaeia archaeon]|nr:METTL5 family protein [Candidatus Nanoarchaeia archaeon]
MNKKKLSIELSKIKPLTSFNVDLEQYPTDCNLVSDILWNAFQNSDILDKVVADFGCGNGVFGIGALLLGAKSVYFLDKDKKALDVCKENLENLNFNNFKLINSDVIDFNKKVDTVLMNPPFGVQNRKADKVFLETAMKYSKVIYSIHKIESKNFIEQLAKEHGFNIDRIIEEEFKIGKIYSFHTKNKYAFKVGIWVLRAK